jgi:putative ABC transport system ATP-binding protein
MITVTNARFAWPGSTGDCLSIPSLVVDQRERVFLYGPSGSGKSTLLGLLAGVLVPRAGTVEILGKSWADMSGSRRDAFRADHVGYIFQQFNLLPYLNVIDNVLLTCRFSRRRAERAAEQDSDPRSQAQRLLNTIGLDERIWSRSAANLSVGQQQRVAAARALLGSPDVVIADEPTSSLDAGMRDEFMALLAAECERAGSALVFVSHDERLADGFSHVVSLPSINLSADVLGKAEVPA